MRFAAQVAVQLSQADLTAVNSTVDADVVGWYLPSFGESEVLEDCLQLQVTVSEFLQKLPRQANFYPFPISLHQVCPSHLW